MVDHGSSCCNGSNSDIISTQASHQREAHVLRNLFRTSSDSESSDDEDQAGGRCERCDIGMNLCVGPQDALEQNVNATSREVGSIQTESSTTVVRTIQHVQLEVCTVGGSIEHRLWPAAEFLVSYILQQSNMEFSNESKSMQRRWNGKSSAIYSEIYRDVQALLQQFSTRQSFERLKVIELGAGVGYTSLELAHHVRKEAIGCKNNIQFLLTDLQSAMPLLERNVQRNFGGQTATSKDDDVTFPIQVQRLEWGNMEDIQNAICWYQTPSLDGTSSPNAPSTDPLLILGSDCVYWESLYGILETTIATLLQNAAPHSICLLANVRRWKRDTHFFQNVLGQATTTTKGQLHCVCLHELVSRSNDNEKGDGIDDSDGLSETGQRQVLRIYAIQWVPQ
jgi:Lysine methyltransferase